MKTSSFNQQVAAAYKKTHREIGIIRRSFISHSPQFLSNMFKLLVIPHSEYCVQLWNPVHIGEISLMEKVHNRFTEMLRQGSVLSHAERNAALGISTQEMRRMRGDLIYLYKLLDEPNFFSAKFLLSNKRKLKENLRTDESK